MAYIRNKIKPWLWKAKNYSFNDVDTKIRLHLNESPFSPPDHVIQHVIEVLKYGNLYMNSKLFTEFRELLAEYVGVDEGNIFPYPGGDAALRAVFYNLVEANDNVLLINPTYGMFNIFSSVRGLNVDKVDLKECGDWWCLDFTDIALKARDSDLVVIDDPNNPTGSPILKGSTKLISELASSVEGFLLIDETYFEFSKYTAVPLIRDYPNVIIARSLSKAFSLAGFRLGYIVSSPEVINVLSKAYTPFDIPLPSLAAGVAALRDRGYVKLVVETIENNREFMISGLRKLGIKAYNSLTNFVLVNDSRDLRGILLKHDVAIKEVGQGLYRFSVGSEEQCVKLLNILGDSLRG
ncbi:MAG: aminotransferase class I/II-fold pyridoxal phosphate-dependent enzyme [Sulfolobales archaeon]